MKGQLYTIFEINLIYQNHKNSEAENLSFDRPENIFLPRHCVCALIAMCIMREKMCLKEGSMLSLTHFFLLPTYNFILVVNKG